MTLKTGGQQRYSTQLTLCGGQDVKIQLPTKQQYSSSHCGQTGTVLMQSLWNTQVQYSVTVEHTGTVLSHCRTHSTQYTVGHTGTVLSHCRTHSTQYTVGHTGTVLSHCRTHSTQYTVGHTGTVLSHCRTHSTQYTVGHTGTVLSHCRTHRYSTQSL